MDVLDVAIVAVLLYRLFRWFKTTRSVYVFVGITVAAMMYPAARLMNLRLATSLMHVFFAVFLVAVVIIFQEDIRRLFEHIALWSLRPRLVRTKVAKGTARQIETITGAVFDLAAQKVGALIVLVGKDPLNRHITGGIDLDGALSEALLKSIFDTHSAGHDGAVIIERDKVRQFACHLPLSDDLDKLGPRGTRHAAGLGLAELTDAMCIVVSEETGDVSVCWGGEINVADGRDGLAERLREFHQEAEPGRKSERMLNLITKNAKEKLAAIFIAVALWFVFVHQSTIVYKSFGVPVDHVGLSSDLVVKGIEPRTVKVVLSGRRRDFVFVDSGDLELALKLFDLKETRQADEEYSEMTITAPDVKLPPGLAIVNIFPRNVRLHVGTK